MRSEVLTTIFQYFQHQPHWLCWAAVESADVDNQLLVRLHPPVSEPIRGGSFGSLRSTALCISKNFVLVCTHTEFFSFYLVISLRIEFLYFSPTQKKIVFQIVPFSTLIIRLVWFQRRQECFQHPRVSSLLTVRHSDAKGGRPKEEA